jgi:DNA-3-methyladenine glycosylase
VKLTTAFYTQDTITVAQNLLGCLLVSEVGGAAERTSGIIVETEAYVREKDPASHAYRGKTGRNQVMYGEPGRAYVYFIYGKYYLLNVVTEKSGTPGAVLIRALEPVDGIEIMKKRRASDSVQELTTGPAKMTQALGITGEHNGVDVTGDVIWIEQYETPSQIQSSPRIGVSDEQPLRFFINGNRYVSKDRKVKRKSEEKKI